LAEFLPDYQYVAYIDEAGDPGLNRVRPIDEVGGSEWLVIGATLIRRANEDRPPKWVGSILDDIGIRQRPDLHFRHLSPRRQHRVCELVAKLPAINFVVASNKKNMRQYRNERVEAKQLSQQWFYNWCCRILIERITDLVLRDSLRKHGKPERVKFEFSDRGGHRYSQTAAYYELLKVQARAQSMLLTKRVPKWETMHYKLVSSHLHEDRAGLQMADVVASAFYTAVDHLDTGPCRPEPAMLLKPRMAFEMISGQRSITDYGVTLQPTPDYSVDITSNQQAIFRHYGYEFQKKW